MKHKFLPAFRGLFSDGWKDHGIRTQMILAGLAVCAAFILRLSAMEWCAGIICAGMVIAAEILNTAVEKLCDLYSEQYDERIRVIKDLAAGAVLAASIAALTVALIILAKHIGGLL